MSAPEGLPALRARVTDLTRKLASLVNLPLTPENDRAVEAAHAALVAAESELARREAEPPSPCPRCHGSGYLTEDPLPGCPAGPSVYEARECPACEGTGEDLTENEKGT